MGKPVEDVVPTPGTEVPADDTTTQKSEENFEKEVAADAGLTTLGSLDGI